MTRLLLCIPIIASLIAPGIAPAQFMGMRQRIPTDANTVILINVEKLLGSRQADVESWEARRKAAVEAGVMALPKSATGVILAGRQDVEFGKMVWELSLMNHNQPVDVASVASRFGGTLDSISERSAARLPNDKFVVQISKTLIGVHTPANRQDVARWLRLTDKSSQERMSPYMQQAFHYAMDVGTPIIMAVDLTDVFSPSWVKARLAMLDSMKDANINVDQLSEVIASVKGMMLGITVTDKTTGAIRVDFGQSPAPFAKIAKPLLIEILQNQGMMINDFHDWKPGASGNTFKLQGQLSTEGTRKVLSVLSLPRSLTDAANAVAARGDNTPESEIKLSTQRYWTSLTTLIEDLREKPKKDHVKTFGQAAVWYDRYARKIDNLPILNVDEAMVDFGFEMANTFRQIEGTMKGVGMNMAMKTRGNSSYSGGYGGSVNYGGYRGFSAGVRPGQASVLATGRNNAVIRSQERTKGAASVEQVWQQIDAKTAEMRRAMTQKYKVEF